MKTSGEAIYWKVGKVTGAQGVRGEVFVLLFSGEAAWLSELENALFAQDPWPGAAEHTFSVQKKRLHRKGGATGLVLKLEGLDDREEAEQLLKGKFLYIPDNFLRSQPGETPYLREFLGLKVLTPEGEFKGTVEAFSSNGPQDLLEVRTEQGQTYSIPLVSDWIVKRDDNVLVMNLPEGLFEALNGS